MITWNEAVEDYLLEVKGTKAHKTFMFYRAQLKPLLAWADAQSLMLNDFKARHMRLYIDERSKTVSRQTCRHDAVCARSFFKFCRRERYIDDNPLSEYEIPKAPRAFVKAPTESDIDKVLRAVKDRWDISKNNDAKYFNVETRRFLRLRDYAMFCILVETGCRISELLAILSADYDRDGKTLTFRHTKSQKPHRVPLQASCDAIEAWIKVKPKQIKAEEMFITVYGNKISYRSWAETYKRYLDYAGVDYFTRHAIRRYTLRKIARENVLSAQRIANHSSLSVTERYLDTTEEEVRQDFERAAPLSKIVMQKKTKKTGGRITS